MNEDVSIKPLDEVTHFGIYVPTLGYVEERSERWNPKFTVDVNKAKAYSTKKGVSVAFASWRTMYSTANIVKLTIQVTNIEHVGSDIDCWREFYEEDIGEYYVLLEQYNDDAEAMSNHNYCRFKELKRYLTEVFGDTP